MNQLPLSTPIKENHIDTVSRLELKIGVGLFIFSLLGLLINFFD